MQISEAKVFQAEERNIKVPTGGMSLMYVFEKKQTSECG